MKKGISYPSARKNVIKSGLLDTPNNILAIEYLKALKKQKSKNCGDTFLIHRHSFGSEYRCIGLLARKIIKVLKLFL